MKKSIFAALLALGMNAATAQVNTGTTTTTGTNSRVVNVPPDVNVRFGIDNPYISPVWSIDGNYYIATFADKNTKMGRVIVYDKNGTVIRSENEMGVGTYPIMINDYFTMNYPDEKNFKVWSSMDGEGNTNYYTKHKGEMMWFDQDGNYTKDPGVKAEADKPKAKPKKKAKTKATRKTDTGTSTNGK